MPEKNEYQNIIQDLTLPHNNNNFHLKRNMHAFQNTYVIYNSEFMI